MGITPGIWGTVVSFQSMPWTGPERTWFMGGHSWPTCFFCVFLESCQNLMFFVLVSLLPCNARSVLLMLACSIHCYAEFFFMHASLHFCFVCNFFSMARALPAFLLWQIRFESYVCGGSCDVLFIFFCWEFGLCISSWTVCVGQFAGRCCTYSCIIC